jgi:hypothetical protein
MGAIFLQVFYQTANKSNHCISQYVQQNASVAGPPARFGSARLR